MHLLTFPRPLKQNDWKVKKSEKKSMQKGRDEKEKPNYKCPLPVNTGPRQKLNH